MVDNSFLCTGYSLGKTVSEHRKGNEEDSILNPSIDKPWSEDDLLLHEFIESSDGVSLTEIVEYFNSKKKTNCSLPSMNSKLMSLSGKDYRLYQDTVKRKESKSKIDEKTGIITIKSITKKVELYYIDDYI